MTFTEKEQNNRMIAAYMGIQETDMGWYDAEEVISLPQPGDNTFEDLRFNSSWDWFMPVYKSLKYELGNDSEEWGYNYNHMLRNVRDAHLDGAYVHACALIKILNTQQGDNNA